VPEISFFTNSSLINYFMWGESGKAILNETIIYNVNSSVC